MPLLLLTALTMIAFAANSLLNRAALAGGDMDAVLFGAVRLAAGALTLGALVALRGRGSALTNVRVFPVAALFAYIFGFSIAYLRLDAGVGALILFGMVQVTMFAGALITNETLPLSRWLGAGLAMSGLAWLFWPAGGAPVPLGPGAAMTLAGIGWGVYSLLGRGAKDPLAETARAFVGATVPAAGLAVYAIMQNAAFSGAGILLAIVSGAITSGLGYALWYHVLPSLGASRAAVAQLTVPVIAIAAGVVLFGETLSWTILVATALVLGGVALALSAR